MNIYEFFNSQDIANHLKDINYQFTPLEMAFVIYHSSHKTFAEKEQAWNELIETTPDCAMRKMYTGFKSERVDYPSLHEFLKRFILINHKTIDKFYQPEGAVWTYNYKMQDGHTPLVRDIFISPDKCLSELKEMISVYDCPPARISITRRELSDEHEIITLKLNKDFEISEVVTHACASKDEWILTQVFANFWCHFPIPFKRGDLVTSKISDIFGPANYVYVFNHLDHWYLKRRDTHARKWANCFGATWCGNLYQHVDDYLNLEFYRGELKDEDRILKAVSNFLNGELNIDELLYAHHQIILEQSVDNAPNLPPRKARPLGLTKRRIR